MITGDVKFSQAILFKGLDLSELESLKLIILKYLTVLNMAPEMLHSDLKGLVGNKESQTHRSIMDSDKLSKLRHHKIF